MVKKTVNQTRGAPLDVRAVVGNLDDPKQRLEALKLYYEDVRPLGDNNFVFKDKDGEYVLYNPKGFDTGDIASVGRDITSGITGGVSAGSALLAGQLGPQVALPEEAVTVPTAAALGSEAGGQAFDRVVDLVMRLKGGETPKREGVVGETIKAATNIGTEIVAPKVLSETGKFLYDKGSNFVRRVIGTGSGKTLKETTDVVKSGRDLGLTMPTAGSATQSPFLLFLEQRIAQFPTGVNTIVNKVEKFSTQLDDAFDNIVSEYGPALREGGDIGSVVKKYAKNAGVRFKETQEKLYDKAYDLVPTDQKTQLSNVLNLQAELNSKLANAPLALKKSLSDTMTRIDDLMKDIKNTGGFDLNTLREIRTNLRQDLGGYKGLIGVQPSGERYLQKLYTTLTDDMNALVNSVGGDDALKALQKADRYTSVNMKNNVAPVINKILDTDADNQAFNFLMAGSKEGNQRFKQILRQFKPEEQDVLKSSILNRMGFKNNEEVFSSRTFLTNYNRLSNSAKGTLFGAPKSETRKSLEKIVDVIENVNNMDAYKNFSRSGDQTAILMTLAPFIGISYFGANTATMVAASSALVTPFASAKLFTNDKFINWLANSAPKMIKNPRSTSFHINRLLTIAGRDEEILEPVLDYITSLNEVIPTLMGGGAEASVPTGEEMGVTTSMDSPTVSELIGDIDQETVQKIQRAVSTPQ
jgi:hypothetical protein